MKRDVIGKPANMSLTEKQTSWYHIDLVYWTPLAITDAVLYFKREADSLKITEVTVARHLDKLKMYKQTDLLTPFQFN